MLSEADYHDDDFEDAITLINVIRKLNGHSLVRRSTAFYVLRKHGDEDRAMGKGLQMSTLRELINKRKELRDATNNSFKQGNASQADSTPSKPNAP